MADNDIAAKIAELRQRYADKLTNELSHLDDFLRAALDRNALQEIMGRLHRLAGSAGTFGWPTVGAAARAAELEVAGWLKAPHLDLSDKGGELQELIGRLAAEMEASTLGPEAKPEDVECDPGESPVGLLTDDPNLATEVCQGLSAFGYSVKRSASIEDLLAEKLSAVVLDADGNNLTDVLAGLGDGKDRKRPPFIVVSSRDDFDTRFACAQAGAEGFYFKPFDVPLVVDRLDRVREASGDVPYRILIIDDDEMLAEHFGLVLEGVGMEACVLSDPTQALEAVKAFRPDLILLDLYMPGCPGPDLARTIRQDDEWLAVPIVYLSAEKDLDAQLRAMAWGGDEFLTKPISDEHLAGGVKVRARRARALSDLMARDSLTGLLKHARIKDQMRVESERARRAGASLTVAMLDIDHFKSVNDTYGHAMGDQVIKTLANLLRKRLRKTDYAGRYGGEEFVVVLPECDLPSAMAMINDIRLRFNQIDFHHSGGSFQSTLSAGVAEIAGDLHGLDLLAAADEALYTAKRSGRNRVIAAGAAGCAQ